MNHDLIERYLYAATKRLPRKQREDVAQELRCLVDDMLTERCGNLIPTEKDIRVVLTELGTPQELYEKYDENAQKCLIGQPYYSTYLVVLKTVLACVAGGMTVASVFLQILEPQAWLTAAAQWLAMLWQGLVSGFAFVTVLFAVFSHRGIRIGEPFNFDDLSPVPKKNQEIPLWKPVLGILFCMAFAVLFLGVPEILGFFRADTGEMVPVFSAAAIRSRWYLIVLFALLGITGESVKLMERQYNRKVMWVTIVTNLVSTLLAVWWLTSSEVYNPVISERLDVLFGESAPVIGAVMGHFQYFFLGVLLFALTLDIIDTVFKTIRK